MAEDSRGLQLLAGYWPKVLIPLAMGLFRDMVAKCRLMCSTEQMNPEGKTAREQAFLG